MTTKLLVRALRGALATALLGAALAVAPAAAAPSAGTALDVPVRHDGVERSYRLFVPKSLPAGRRVPLVLVLHGLNGETKAFAALSKMDVAAARYGFLVAYPTGLSRSWNAGTCCGESAATGVDDVGFLTKVVDDLALTLPVDRERVYAAGFSNGGMMALRAGCERPEVFAAVASVMGTLQAPCAPASPVSVLQVTGGRDSLVPYRGMRWSTPLGTALTPVPVAVGTWERADGCSGLPVRSRTAVAEVRAYDRCAGGASVRSVVLPATGHTWPGDEHNGWHTPDEVWRFFEAHARPGPPVGTPPVLSTRVVASRQGGHVAGYLDGRFDVVIGRRVTVEARRGSRWVGIGSVVTDVEGRFRFLAPSGGTDLRLRYAGAPGLPSQTVVA